MITIAVNEGTKEIFICRFNDLTAFYSFQTLHESSTQITDNDKSLINLISSIKENHPSLEVISFENHFDLITYLNGFLSGYSQNKQPIKNINNDTINPDHYKTKKGFQVIEIIEAFNLDFKKGNAIKYILRAGQKEGSPEKEDLEKAKWYIQRIIDKL